MIDLIILFAMIIFVLTLAHKLSPQIVRLMDAKATELKKRRVDQNLHKVIKQCWLKGGGFDNETMQALFIFNIGLYKLIKMEGIVNSLPTGTRLVFNLQMEAYAKGGIEAHEELFGTPDEILRTPIIIDDPTPKGRMFDEKWIVRVDTAKEIEKLEERIKDLTFINDMLKSDIKHLERKAENIILQAKCWAMEAKTQQSISAELEAKLVLKGSEVSRLKAINNNITKKVLGK